MAGKQVRTVRQLQPALIDRLKRVIDRQELAHAYLLVGPAGSGKSEVAQWLALRLFCLHPQDDEPDLTCPECQRILSGNHPDVVVAAPEGRQIKVDRIRYLKSEFTKSAMEGSQKLFIIQDAEKMTTSAANSLLKFIEEPGPGTYILMLTSNKSAVLPTIQSRTQVLEMAPLKRADLLRVLADHGVSQRLAQVAVGLTDSVAAIERWCGDDWLSNAVQGVTRWYQHASAGQMLAFVDVTTDLVKLAGHDRERQQVLLDLMTLLWRDTLLVASGVTVSSRLHFADDLDLVKQVSQRYSLDQLLAVSQLTLDTRHQLEQNISFQNVSEQLTIQIVQTLNGNTGARK
ncbi:DNA polymerase III subunit delta' [Limosilactobacillus antri]|uniref:DNA polymerase III, delta' subunit n=1 Tax=Limosilactobacillus antri DSM 16041 TaxID=525309 RepID=C8P6P9_9LACO|nr:DNA polymerase III subunit delta' [Limosilactobacillus antri]EEW53837.1 DNA polymerase III, delta' subunit [Limosilactobacillus antri DSM 16041]KRK60932.1 DNA-directed DNA polymerase III subunit delta [Limosilactobacillus antri DSM 16041]